VTRSRRWRTGAAALSGLLLALARPPFDLGPLALVALVPLFLAWRDRGPRGAAFYAFVAGAVYHGVLVSWTWYFGAVAVVPLVAALSAYWALVGAAVGWFARRGLRSPWLIAALWVLADWAVARFPLEGFSWGEVGYALHDLPPARDVASGGGVALVSFLVVAGNALLADLWHDVRTRASRAAFVRASAGVVAVAVVTGAIAAFRPEPVAAGPLRVALLQGNDKNRALTDEEKREDFLTNSHLGLAAGITDPVDLIVFPESSLDNDPREDDELARELGALARRHDAWVLGNTVADAPDGRAVNLNLLYDPEGNLQGTYAKRHLVPYGERVPYRSVLERFITELDRIPRDFVPGDEPGIFRIAGYDVATVICFESAFGYQIRPLVRDGAQVIVVSTNNRSYRRSANSAQHVAIGQMRAAENGRPVVQAAISGISALIDASGNLHAETELFERTRLEGTVTATSGTTWYVRYGDWIVWLSLFGVVAALVIHVVRRRPRSVESAGPASTAAPPTDAPEPRAAYPTPPASPAPTPAGDRV
jgi:apolipoprotein N-acyltransferase